LIAFALVRVLFSPIDPRRQHLDADNIFCKIINTNKIIPVKVQTNIVRSKEYSVDKFNVIINIANNNNINSKM